MKITFNYIFQILKMGFVVSFVILIFFILIFISQGKEITLNSDFIDDISKNFIYGIVLTFVNTLFSDYLNEKLGWKENLKKRIIWGVIGGIVVSFLGVFFVRMVIKVFIEQNSFSGFFQNEKFSLYIMPLVVSAIVTIFFYLLHFYKKYQENQVKEQKIIAGTASAKFETLKNQIDPHFLFNSLNVLSSLIEENPDSAQKFTTSLSKIYRYVLEQKDKELVSVEEELQFAKTYMNLLKMRFENSITFELPTDFNNPEAKVVPLSLQLLLENTIKHNVVSEQRPLHIKIYVENNYLVVENNLQKKEVLQDRRGVGLQNIVNRYGLISERKVLIEETKEYFRVMIPILTKQVAIMETQNIYNENMAYMKAKERVEQLKGFYANLLSYCMVIPILIIINLNTSSQFHWFWFPMLGWGFGVTMHALETFGYGKGWEQRKIQQILEKENQNNNKWN